MSDNKLNIVMKAQVPNSSVIKQEETSEPVDNETNAPIEINFDDVFPKAQGFSFEVRSTE